MRDVSVGVCLLVLCGLRGIAAGHDEVGRSHVRAESAQMRALIDQAARRSSTVRALVGEIDRSNVTVYVRSRLFASQLLEGRIGFLGTSANARFLVIELACIRPLDMQMATLAHELQHAVEIARAPWVVGAGTLAQYYAQIGVRVPGDAHVLTFETEAARTIGLRARNELFRKEVTTDHR